MEPLEAIDIARDALWVLIKVAGPLMMISLVVGLSIALFQALTQIQEMTLTFVPKIVAIFFSLMMLLPYMFQTVADFHERLMEKVIEVGGKS